MPTVGEIVNAPPSTNPDDYTGLKPHEPGTVGAIVGSPLQGWSDESIPREARLGSFIRERGRDQTVKWDQIAPEAKSLFGVDPAGLRKHVELERARSLAEKDQTLSEGDYGTRLISNLARDLPFSPGKIIEDREYQKALKAFGEGTHTGADIGIIANYEARLGRQKNESEIIRTVLRPTSSLAKTAAEFLLGSPAAGAAARAAGLGKVGTFGLETAARAATVPSLGAYDKAFEQAFKAGRTEPNAQDIVQGFTVGLVNSLIAGQVERFGAKLPIPTAAGRIGTGAVAGTVEEDVAAAVLKNMNLETRYGPLVELMQGKRGDNLGRLAYSLIGEGIFAGAGALRGPGAFDGPPKLDVEKSQAVIDAGVKAIDAEGAAGKSADETAASLSPIADLYQDALHNNRPPDDFLEAALGRMGEDASPAAKAYAEELAETLPKEIDPFEGLNDQQVRDYADVARSKPRKNAKLETVKEQLLADPNVQALLQTEGRLPRPERPRPEPAAEPAVEPRLPRELAGAKPRYSFGAKQFDVRFESDIDRAAYITAQTKKSRSDDSYRKFLRDAGLSDAEIAAHGQAVRSAIKEMARVGESGATLTLTNQRRAAGEPAQPAQPEPAPETPPESPRTADRPPDDSTGAQVDDRAPAAPTEAPGAAEEQFPVGSRVVGGLGVPGVAVDGRVVGYRTDPKTGKRLAEVRSYGGDTYLVRLDRLSPVLPQVEESAPAAILDAPAADPRTDRLKRLTMKARERSAVTAPRPGRTEAGAELRPPPEVLSPAQRQARAEVLLERAGDQARQLRALRFRAESGRESPTRPPEGVGEPEALTSAERKELKRLAMKAREPAEVAPAVEKQVGTTGDDTTTLTTAFRRLDQAGNNFVSLADLRAELPHLSRADQDALFQKLRKERKLSLKSFEGYTVDQNDPAEAAQKERLRDASIEDHGETLAYASLLPAAGRADSEVGWLTDKTAESTPEKWTPENNTFGEALAAARPIRDWLSQTKDLPPETRQQLGAEADRILGEKIGRALADPRLADVPADQKAVWGTAVRSAYAALPEPVRYLTAQQGSVQFHRNHQELSEAVQRTILADPLLARDLQSPIQAVRQKAEADRADLLNRLEQIKTGKFVGLGAHWDGTIHIDGAGLLNLSNPKSTLAGPYGPTNVKVMAVNEIATHEIGHQIAYLLGRVDHTTQWGSAHKANILTGEGEPPKLTRYASTDAGEGFAEFIRVLYSSNVSTAHIKATFPDPWEFCRKLQLLPAERDGRKGPVRDVFESKIGTDKAHLDVTKGSWVSRLTAGVRGSIGWLEADRPPRTPDETALANEVQDRERVARGDPPLATAARLSNPEVWEQAMARVAADPDAPARLVNEIETTPRPISTVESALLLHREITLNNAFHRAATDLSAARAANAPPGDIDRLQQAADGYLESLRRLEVVHRKVGTEGGRFLQFRRQLAKEDYSLGSMLLKAEVAFGRKLTDAETAEITAQQAEIEQTRTRLAAAEGSAGVGPVQRGALGVPVAAGTARPAAPAGQKGDITDLRIAADKAVRRNTATLERGRQAKLPPGKRFLTRLGEALGFTRSLRTAFDLSMIFRQGGVFAVTRPITSFQTARRMQEHVSERGYDRVMMEIRSRENAALYEDSGLYIADVDGPASAQEEAFTGGLARRMAESKVAPARWLGQGVRGSERLYTGHLNLLRANVFDAMVSSLSQKGRPTLEEARAIANFINVATGRGPLGQTLGKAAVPLSNLFFSPRFVASRFQLLAGQPLYGGTAATRKLVAWEYARLLGGLGLFYTLVQFLAGDEAEMTFDPRSTDFGKIRFGDTAIDPLAGLAQTTRFASQVATGEQKDRAGVVTDIRGKGRPAGGDDTMAVISDFVRQKFAPAPGEMVNILVGENAVGEPTTLGSVAVGLSVPMSVDNILEGFDRLNVPRATATGLLNVVGVGVNLPFQKDPGQRAISDVHAMRRRWEFDLGRPPEPRQGKPATAGMVKALADDDFEAFRAARTDFLNRQILQGRTRAQALESFRESADRIDPLEGRLNARDRAKFLASRRPEERARIDEARAVARERRRKLIQWWQRAAQERR